MQLITAIIAQGLSWLTTLGAVAFVVQPGADIRRWGIATVIAVVFEALFFGMKEAIFRPGCLNIGIGLAGFGADGLVNAGGVMAIALSLLTFGPVALILGVAEIDVSSPDARLWASAGVSLVLGLILSVLPHGLWRLSRRRRGEPPQK